MNKEIYNLTVKFHDTYEKLAKEYNYKTREDTKKFNIKSDNGKLIYATVQEVTMPLLQELERYKNIVEEFINKFEDFIETMEYEKIYHSDLKELLNKLKELKGE